MYVSDSPSRDVDRTSLEPEIEVSVVMPCLNEVRTVGRCIDKAFEAFQRLGVRGEVVVADNGSTDGSPDIARAHGACVVSVDRKGYGCAVQGGIEAAQGCNIIIGDADDSYDFSQLEAFLERLRAGDDLVVGNRFQGGIRPGAMPWLHRYLGNPLLTGVLNLFFQSSVGDAHCGLRAFRKDSYRRLGLVSTGMEFASEMVAKAVLQQQKISEVPIILYRDGRDRPPHLRTFRDGWRHLCLLLRMCPRGLYLLLALLLLGSGLAFLGWRTRSLPIADAAVASLWLMANVFLGTAAWKWARKFFPQDGYLELIQHSILFSWACIVAVATALGATATLTGPALLCSVVAVSLLALAVTRARPTASLSNPVPLERGEVPWLALWAVVLGYWICHVITQGLLKFPTDWDSLAYHMPLIDQWLQAGSLCTTGCAWWSNPGNNELLALWAVGPFSGDFLVSLNNLPAAVLFACSSVALAKRVGLPRPLAHLTGLALVCHFVVLRQLVDVENDVAVAACFLAALSYAIRSPDDSGHASLLLGAISLGLLTGIKYYALGYALLAFALWLLLVVRAHGARPFLRVLVAGGAGILALGSFWYLRNWLMTGSPLYPKEFFKHPDVLSQVYPEVARTSFFGNRSPELLDLYIDAIWQKTGPCQLFGFLEVPFSLAWLLASAGWYAWRAKDFRQARMRGAIAILLVGTGLLLGMTPMAVEDSPGTLNQMYWQYCPVRYGLCFLSTATLASVLFVGDMFYSQQGPERQAPNGKRRRMARLWLPGLRWFAGLALAGAILFQLLWADLGPTRNWIEGLFLVAGLLVVGFTWALLKAMWPRPPLRLSLLLIVAVLPAWAWACALLSDSWHQEFIPYYDTYDAMSAFVGLQEIEQKGADPQTILVLQPRCYAFFGSQRQHRVYQPVYVFSPEWLMQLLDKENITFIVAVREGPSIGQRRFPGWQNCRARHPNRFHLIKKTRDIVVVKVVPESVSSTTIPGGKE